MSLMPSITLSHMDLHGFRYSDMEVLLDELDRKNPWADHLVLLPWMAPQRMIGFVHKAVEPGKEPFVLHAAYNYIEQFAVQAVGQDKLKAVPGPRICLPFAFISPVDIEIYDCPSAIWIARQGTELRDYFVSLMRQQLFPPIVEVADKLPSIVKV